jgi:hypothetical protein
MRLRTVLVLAAVTGCSSSDAATGGATPPPATWNDFEVPTMTVVTSKVCN